MGREIKRVPASFNWPLEKKWSGYEMPEELHSHTCDVCEGQGYNVATQKIADEFYDSNNFGVNWSYEYNVDPNGNPATRPPWKVLGDSHAWHTKITQDEVQALIDEGRLMDFTHTWSRETGWVRREDGYIPSAQEVNEWAKQGMGHDGINRCILVRARATNEGVFGYCEHCNGEGSVYRDEEHRQAHDAWECTEVPTGEWWQVWETVSEGSPVTPAFATGDELINYLVKYGDSWDQSRGDGGWKRDNAIQFVKNAGWAPSLVISNGFMYAGAREINEYDD